MRTEKATARLPITVIMKDFGAMKGFWRDNANNPS
jgi:hypothetical protein